jgi:glutaredoxin-like YruB-family protein
MKKVSIYTTPTCTYCKAAKEFFKENNVEYEEFDVSADAAKRQEMIEKSGQMGVPVILVKDEDGGQEPEMVIGFDKASLSEMLGV